MKVNIAALFGLVSTVIAGGSTTAQTTINSACKRACYRIASNSTFISHVPGNGNLTVWDLKQQHVQSACRVLPKTTEEVSRILAITVSENCTFAIKGGGHARYADDSVSVGGVTIDMARMRSLDLSPDKGMVKLGSGHVLHSIYEGLDKYNLTTVGGRAGTVGLGGYALGGGISHLSPKYGLAMDNVFEYELVVPNATVVKVNENTEPDLYFALRGGMNNFGIVTHFTMRAVQQGQIYAGERSYTADKGDELIQQAYMLTTEWKNDTDMSFYYGFGYDQETDEYSFSFSPEYSRPILSPAPFKELEHIQFESNSVRIGWASDFSGEVASGTPPGGRNLFATVTYYPSPDLDKSLQNIMMDEIQAVKSVPGFFPNLIFQPLYEAAIQAGKEGGGNAAGIDADGPLTVVLLTALWEKSEDDEAINSFVSRWTERATSASKDAHKHHPWLYINYASKEQDPFSGYGEDNLRRLRSIQKSVDPEGILTSTGLCKGYFKLF